MLGALLKLSKRWLGVGKPLCEAPDLKLCKDCRWVYTSLLAARCTNPEVGIDLVHGNVKFMFASTCRLRAGICKPQAILFQPIEKA